MIQTKNYIQKYSTAFFGVRVLPINDGGSDV